jgi:hypothetical protein
MIWKPGDFAILLPHQGPLSQSAGSLVQVVETPVKYYQLGWLEVEGAFLPAPMGERWYVKPNILQPLPPPEMGSWGRISHIWKPATLREGA